MHNACIHQTKIIYRLVMVASMHKYIVLARGAGDKSCTVQCVQTRNLDRPYYDTDITGYSVSLRL